MSETRLYLGVRPEPVNEDHETFMRRLRAFLKAALRSYRIRCTAIVVAKPEGEEVAVEEVDCG